MKLIIFLILILTIFFPLKAEAKEVSSKYFSLSLDIGTHNHVAPNDYFSDTFIIENQTLYPVKVRVSDVSNIENSLLYSVLQAKWDTDSASSTYTTFDELPNDWYTIEPGDTHKLDLNIHFPSNLGNEYQSARLQARFTFECQIPESGNITVDTQSPAEHHAVISIPPTGDAAQKQLLNLLGNCITAFLVVIAIYCSCGMLYQKCTGTLFFPFGYRPVVILSGSMEDELMTGSTVIVKKTKEVEENDIIFFITKDGTPVIHRYIATDNHGQFITKGDANPKEDLEHIDLKQVQGKVVYVFGK